MSTTRILELAAIISSNTNTVNDYYQSNGLPSPSFDAKDSTVIPMEVDSARDAVLDATMELHDLLLDPLDLMYHHFNHNSVLSLHAIQRFKIAKLVPIDGHASFAQIAEATNVRESEIRRLLRYAMTFRVFHEPEEGFVAHTAASKALTDPNVDDWAATVCEETWPAAQKTVEALEKWPQSREPQHTGFSLSNNTVQPIYEVLSASPLRAARFGGMMAAYTASKLNETNHLVAGYGWGGLGNALVVDVGGSQGHISTILARVYPQLSFVVQDLPAAITQVSLPSDLAQRVRIEAHNFFSPQTVVADVYYFRWIFHNWADSDAVRILRALIPALQDGARVVIHDDCMPDARSVAQWREKVMRSADVCMLELMNARGRYLSDWKDLLLKADARFQFVGFTRPYGSDLAFIEARWQVDQQ